MTTQHLPRQLLQAAHPHHQHTRAAHQRGCQALLSNTCSMPKTSQQMAAQSKAAASSRSGSVRPVYPQSLMGLTTFLSTFYQLHSPGLQAGSRQPAAWLAPGSPSLRPRLGHWRQGQEQPSIALQACGQDPFEASVNLDCKLELAEDVCTFPVLPALRGKSMVSLHPSLRKKSIMLLVLVKCPVVWGLPTNVPSMWGLAVIKGATEDAATCL
ncbi:hypothetical protein V8C86DRAFT_15545 [Haematococcus lacustris]